MTNASAKPQPTTTTPTPASSSASETGAVPAPDRQEPSPGKTPKKGGHHRKTKGNAATVEDERVVSLSLPAGLLKRVKVLSALTGESVSDMVASALTSKVKKELRAAIAELDG